MSDAPALTPHNSLWALRVLVVALAATTAVALSGATDERASAAGSVATVAWGALVATVVIAVVVPGPVGLTVARMALPSTVPVAAAALGFGAPTGWGIAALALALLATSLVLSAETAEAFVQAGAYGDERRLPLRAPAAVLLPMALSWLVWCATAVAGALLLCAAQWALGAVLTAAALALGWLLGRRFHVFSRRWLVLVPAGVVVHDSFCLGETLMVMRPNVALAQLAPAGTEAADLTGPAAGHVLEITMREMVLAVRAGTRAQPKGSALHVQSMLVAPSRPGRALQALAAAKVPVG